MKPAAYLIFLSGAIFLVGCGHSEQQGDDEASIQANLAKLDKDDRADAELQKYCCIHRDHRLGSMGVPVKIMLKNQDGEEVTGYLCCKSCEKAARKSEAATAAVVQELYVQGYMAQLGPEDRKLAEAQKYCASDGKTPLGSMGKPDKYVIKDKDGVAHPVFLCCAGCSKLITDEPKTWQLVQELMKKHGGGK
jgi:hypothetical protein